MAIFENSERTILKGFKAGNDVNIYMSLHIHMFIMIMTKLSSL